MRGWKSLFFTSPGESAGAVLRRLTTRANQLGFDSIDQALDKISWDRVSEALDVREEEPSLLRKGSEEASDLPPVNLYTEQEPPPPASPPPPPPPPPLALSPPARPAVEATTNADDEDDGMAVVIDFNDRSSNGEGHGYDYGSSPPFTPPPTRPRPPPPPADIHTADPPPPNAQRNHKWRGVYLVPEISSGLKVHMLGKHSAICVEGTSNQHSFGLSKFKTQTSSILEGYKICKSCMRKSGEVDQTLTVRR